MDTVVADVEAVEQSSYIDAGPIRSRFFGLSAVAVS